MTHWSHLEISTVFIEFDPIFVSDSIGYRVSELGAERAKADTTRPSFIQLGKYFDSDGESQLLIENLMDK